MFITTYTYIKELLSLYFIKNFSLEDFVATSYFNYKYCAIK